MIICKRLAPPDDHLQEVGPSGWTFAFCKRQAPPDNHLHFLLDANANRPTNRQGEFRAIRLFEGWNIEGRYLQFGHKRDNFDPGNWSLIALPFWCKSLLVCRCDLWSILIKIYSKFSLASFYRAVEYAAQNWFVEFRQHPAVFLKFCHGTQMKIQFQISWLGQHPWHSLPPPGSLGFASFPFVHFCWIFFPSTKFDMNYGKISSILCMYDRNMGQMWYCDVFFRAQNK